MREVLSLNLKRIKQSKILSKLKLKKKNYLLFSFHREENVDDINNLNDIMDTLDYLSKKFKMKCIISTHPRTKLRLSKAKKIVNKNLIFLKPMGFLDYNFLQINSFCTISDSGTITEESDILNFPAVTIRNSHERPEGMDAGTLIMCGLKKLDVYRSVSFVTKSFKLRKRDKVFDYLPESVSHKMIKIILSYTNLVNKKVWFKK